MDDTNDSDIEELRKYEDSLSEPKNLQKPLKYKDKIYTKVRNVQPIILLRSYGMCCCKDCHYTVFYKVATEHIDETDTLPIIGTSNENCHCTNPNGIHIRELKDEEYPVCEKYC